MDTEEVKIKKDMKKKSEAQKVKAQKDKDYIRKHRIGFIVSLVIFLLLVIALNLFCFAPQIFRDPDLVSLFGTDKDGNTFPNGYARAGYEIQQRLPSLISTIIAILIAFAIIFIANFVTNLVTTKGKKAKTIGSLVKSCIKYIVILVTIGVVLTFWGVDVASVVAGLGVLTLIVGLGCQSLISDVVSGLFIVFDDYFSVGDIVIIDGFRGTVQSIGLKTVKLLDGAGNIKALTNSSITTVINLSRHPSLITATCDVSYDEDITHVEGVIARALPEIKKKLPMLLDGPYYKGLSGYDNCGYVVLLAATCEEKNRFQATRDLNEELFMALNNAGVEIPVQQISLYPQSDPSSHQKPTDEDRKLSEELLRQNRQVVEEDEDRESFFEKAKRSLEESSNN